MDTTGQRATQKINIKLLLSEPTKNKFPKSFLLLLVCVCVCGGVVAVLVGEGRSPDGNEHGLEGGTILFIGSNKERASGRCQPYARNAESSGAEAGHPTLGCPRGSGPQESRPTLAHFHGETCVPTSLGERLFWSRTPHVGSVLLTF